MDFPQNIRCDVGRDEIWRVSRLWGIWKVGTGICGFRLYDAVEGENAAGGVRVWLGKLRWKVEELEIAKEGCSRI